MSKHKVAKHTPPPTTPPVYTQPWFIGVIVTIIGVVAVAFLAFGRGSGGNPNFTPEYTGGPRAEFDNETLDFGDVQFNKMVTAAFKVQNVGDRPLNIIGEPYVELVEGC